MRSSSLLEDRLGAAFSGKYKSLFLANLGPKRERLAALTDAIAEVYASAFSPDPIEYRALRGLLDLHEIADDYPVLVAPGQPGLRVNQTPEAARRYSPKKADVIYLETGVFETVGMLELLARHGEELPLARQMISLADRDHLRQYRSSSVEQSRAVRTTTGAGGCAWPSASPSSSMPPASASRPPTCSGPPRTGLRGRPATSTSCFTWRQTTTKGVNSPGWLDGWSRALAEANYLRTGCETEGLPDVRDLTDADIANGESFAAKIDAVTDAARPAVTRSGAAAAQV